MKYLKNERFKDFIRDHRFMVGDKYYFNFNPTNLIPINIRADCSIRKVRNSVFYKVIKLK